MVREQLQTMNSIMRQYKRATVFVLFSGLSERFDCSSSPLIKKPLSNQLNFWTAHIQGIVKVKNTAEVQAAMVKLDGGHFYLTQSAEQFD